MCGPVPVARSGLPVNSTMRQAGAASRTREDKVAAVRRPRAVRPVSRVSPMAFGPACEDGQAVAICNGTGYLAQAVHTLETRAASYLCRIGGRYARPARYRFVMNFRFNSGIHDLASFSDLLHLLHFPMSHIGNLIL